VIELEFINMKLTPFLCPTVYFTERLE